MPFGLTGAPDTYQMVMDHTLQEEINGPTPCVTQYLDDTLLYSSDFAEHLRALDGVLLRSRSPDHLSKTLVHAHSCGYRERG